MKAFIANFGRANHLWSRCKENSIIATIEDSDIHAYRVAGDREGYIEFAIAFKKTSKGVAPTRQVAGRWFNLVGIVSSTTDDLWIHREKDELWWTVSKNDSVLVTLEKSYDPGLDRPKVYVFQKKTNAWSNSDAQGRPLYWRALHPRAREFLFTEGTMQELSEEHADYARALVNGENLDRWHSRERWNSKQIQSGKMPVISFNAVQRAAYRMADTALKTAANANGQETIRTVKNKEFRFKNVNEMREYLEQLVERQGGVCALTSLPLQFDGENSDTEMLASLDRIDSNGHYEVDNLQVVCRFVNRWKSDSEDHEFRRLIRLIQRL